MELIKTFIVIPARYGSQRLPGKPLRLINGKPLITLVIEQALKVKNCNGIIVATDNEFIADVASRSNVEVIMTSESCKNGTERLIKVSEKFDADYFINLQGDEPLIDPFDIEILIESLKKNNDDIVTMYHQIDKQDAEDNSRVKLITNSLSEVLYFSRTLIPFGAKVFSQHIGIYGFSRESLYKIKNLKESTLEKFESLEQLRWLENGLKIKALPTNNISIGVDEEPDITKVENILNMRKIKVLFSDVDGILTDGTIWYGKNGEELKGFNSRDGLAIKLLISNGIDVCLISARDSEPLRR